MKDLSSDSSEPKNAPTPRPDARQAAGGLSPRRRGFSLSDEQIVMIEEALCTIGSGTDCFGEVHLIVDKGRLRFIHVERSYDVQRWRRIVVDGYEDGSTAP